MIEIFSIYIVSFLSLAIFCFVSGYVLRFGLKHSGIYQDFIILALILLSCICSRGVL